MDYSVISEYYLGGESDLFKAPAPIIEEPVVGFEAIMSCGEIDIFSQVLKESIQCDELLLSEIFYECKKDILAKEENETEVLNIQINPLDKTSSLSSTDEYWMHNTPVRPNFLDLNGMRRAFSEGDIKALGNGNMSLVNSPQLMTSFPNENRMQKLSRYWNKKSKRNFGRKIKYACRKALADTQPRIRGRFAKTEEIGNC